MPLKPKQELGSCLFCTSLGSWRGLRLSIRVRRHHHKHRRVAASPPESGMPFCQQPTSSTLKMRLTEPSGRALNSCGRVLIWNSIANGCCLLKSIAGNAILVDGLEPSQSAKQVRHRTRCGTTSPKSSTSAFRLKRRPHFGFAPDFWSPALSHRRLKDNALIIRPIRRFRTRMRRQKPWGFVP